MPAKSKKPARAKASTPAGRSRAANRSARRSGSARAGTHKPAARKRATTGKPAARKPAARKSAARKTRSRKPAARKRVASKRRRSLIPRFWRGSFGAIAARRRLIVAAAVVVGLAAAYFGWFRDSPLVAVRDVEVVGVSGSQKQRIEKTLGRAAKKMTTLHVQEDALAAAAGAFPDIESVSADASFPSGLEITVEQRPPVLLAESKGQTVAVADDGALLPGVEVPKGQELPAIDVSGLPESGRLQGEDLEQALIVGAAPEPLRPLLEKVTYDGEEGVVIILRGGLPVHFGTGTRADAKWAALAAVLADPKLKQLTYVDVRVPERAAAGGAAPPPPPEEELAPADPAATAVDPVAPAADPAAVAPADAAVAEAGP